MSISKEVARSFSEEWLKAWNSHDIDEILSHYTEDFVMSSPLIISRMGIKSGILEGKKAAKEYWSLGLKSQPNLFFEIVDICLGVDSITIIYNGPRGLSSEMFFLNQNGKVYRAYAHYICIPPGG